MVAPPASDRILDGDGVAGATFITDVALMRGFGVVAEGGFALCYSFKVAVGCC